MLRLEGDPAGDLSPQAVRSRTTGELVWREGEEGERESPKNLPTPWAEAGGPATLFSAEQKSTAARSHLSRSSEEKAAKVMVLVARRSLKQKNVEGWQQHGTRQQRTEQRECEGRQPRCYLVVERDSVRR